MARITGFVGDVTGKMGNMVAYTRRGVNLARQYQPNVTNPNTRRQQKSRRIFAEAYNVARQLAAPVTMAYAAVSSTYERQNFVGKLIDAKAISVSQDLVQVTVDWASVPVSWGPLVPIRTGGRPTSEAPQKITIPLSADSVADSNCLIDGVTPINCLVFGVAYSVEMQDSLLALVGYKDVNGQWVPVNGGAIETTPEWSGVSVHVWAFCKQSPTPLNDIPITQLPPRIRYRSSPARYYGEVVVA